MLKINSKIPLLALVVSLLFVSCSSKKMDKNIFTNNVADANYKNCIQCKSSSILPKSRNKGSLFKL